MLIFSIFLAVLILALAFYLFGRYEGSAALGRNSLERPTLPADEDPTTQPLPPAPQTRKPTDDELFENIVKRLGK